MRARRSGVVARAQLPDTAFSVTIPIGQIPTGVAINATGSRAYVTHYLTEEPETGNVRVWPLAVLLRDEHLPFVGGPRDEPEEPDAPPAE